jgi:hypothetical protein
MPEPTVQAIRFAGTPTVRMKEDGFRMAALPCVCLMPWGRFSPVGSPAIRGKRSHMSKFQFHLVAASLPEVR